MGERAGRFRVSLDVEMGFDGGESDDTEFDLDSNADLSVAFAKVLEELRPMTLYQLQLDWGIEPGRLMLTVLDTKTDTRKMVDLYWEGVEWRER